MLLCEKDSVRAFFFPARLRAGAGRLAPLRLALGSWPQPYKHLAVQIALADWSKEVHTAVSQRIASLLAPVRSRCAAPSWTSTTRRIDDDVHA